MRQVYWGIGFESLTSNNVVGHTSPVTPCFRWGTGGNGVSEGQHPWLVESVFRNWRIAFSSASDVDWTYTVFVDDVATALSITIPAGSTSGTNLTDTAAVPYDSILRVRRTPTPGFSLKTSSWKPTIYWSIEADHDEDDAISGYGGNGLGSNLGSGDRYTGLFAVTDLWGTSIGTQVTLTNPPGTLLAYSPLLASTPVAAGGTSIETVIMVNGVAQDGSGATPDTRLTFTTQTSLTWTGTLTLAECDRVQVRATYTGFGAGEGNRIALGVRFQADTDHKFWVGGYTGITGSNAATQYIEGLTTEPNGNGWNSTESLRQIRGSDTTVVCTGLCVWLLTAPAAGRSWTYEPRVNSVAGGQSVTIANTDTTGDTPTGTFSFGLGDLLAFQSTPTGSPTASGGIAWVFVGDASTPPAPGTGTLIVQKVTVPPATGHVFAFSAPTLTPTSFSLEHGQEQRFENLAAGTYGLEESPPSGWELVSVTVSDGSPVDAIAISAGETVTVVFNNALIAEAEGAGSFTSETECPHGSAGSVTGTGSYTRTFAGSALGSSQRTLTVSGGSVVRTMTGGEGVA